MIATDSVVIVGAGLGALSAALHLAPHPVLIISPDPLGEGASSAWAQGGVAAAMAATDSPEAHARDTVAAGAGTVDAEVAALVTRAAHARIAELTERGTPFDRDGNGNYVLSREAAHSAARVVRVAGDQAGRQIMETLIAAVRATPSIQVIENVLATGLEVEHDVATGIWCERANGRASRPTLIQAPAILLAGGGSGGLFAQTTNPPRICGQVIGLAARAGAILADPEFVQFHPTAFDIGVDPAPLATEALRGEGAVLINADGERFMTAIHPDAELAPRDIVARAIFAQRQVGKRPMLDTRDAIGGRIFSLFPGVAETCKKAGIDPTQSPIPITAAAHYHMGGVQTDAQGRASLDRLWVCGEASSTGLHGANRLASNGLLEALVYARLCADDIARMVAPTDAPLLEIAFTDGGPAPTAEAVIQLRRTMSAHVGVVRNAEGLLTALRIIADLEREHACCTAFVNMTATATLIAAAALQREESRGGHFRSDFPERDPEQATRTRMTLEQARTIRDAACKETT
ncbi:L-aspartate oxidase [Qingshengfaniella alkalisoli]|uniref:L-aspartate oxidase n=1 Tax=Qingshengfaniella alkalisoli TaxID=2599296 RepID=A0A5B8IZY4_9RHOB|nr:L-aspartate oxidase [Qingshengfaniella alkalisoli]QDY71632.1 L-aspartate oxidase [Qingshengfaniella alkalisoli]